MCRSSPCASSSTFLLRPGVFSSSFPIVARNSVAGAGAYQPQAHSALHPPLLAALVASPPGCALACCTVVCRAQHQVSAVERRPRLRLRYRPPAAALSAGAPRGRAAEPAEQELLKLEECSDFFSLFLFFAHFDSNF